MTDTLHPKTRTSLRPSLPVVLFLLVYGAAMVILFAPRDMIGATPASLLNLGE